MPARSPRLIVSLALSLGLFSWLRRKKQPANGTVEAHAKHAPSARRRRKNREHLRAVRAERARGHHEGHGKAR